MHPRDCVLRNIAKSPTPSIILSAFEHSNIWNSDGVAAFNQRGVLINICLSRYFIRYRYFRHTIRRFMLRLYAENISGFPVLSSPPFLPPSLLGNDIAIFARVFARESPSIAFRVSHSVYAWAYRHVARTSWLLRGHDAVPRRSALSRSSRACFIMLRRNVGEISSSKEKERNAMRSRLILVK